MISKLIKVKENMTDDFNRILNARLQLCNRLS